MDAIFRGDVSCKQCAGIGTIKRNIGHPGRCAIFTCDCVKRMKPQAETQFGGIYKPDQEAKNTI